MKTYIYSGNTLMILVFIAAVASGCSPVKPADENPYVKELVEKQIGESEYYLSIPGDYSLEETEGPDFTVFHFRSTDTTSVTAFSGGMYFGNHPSEFIPGGEDCTSEKVQSEILEVNQDWTLYTCGGKYSLQTIADSGSEEGWNSYIHAFGHATSAAELEKLRAVFSTLKRKEKAS